MSQCRRCCEELFRRSAHVCFGGACYCP
nr:unnamed protein product [Callosobruchus analis]